MPRRKFCTIEGRFYLIKKETSTKIYLRNLETLLNANYDLPNAKIVKINESEVPRHFL